MHTIVNARSTRCEPVTTTCAPVLDVAVNLTDTVNDCAFENGQPNTGLTCWPAKVIPDGLFALVKVHENVYGGCPPDAEPTKVQLVDGDVMTHSFPCNT